MAANKLLEGTIVMIQLWTYLLVLRACVAVDTISANQSIKDGQTIASDGYSFEMGFFSPGISAKKYQGICYKRVANRTVVWVANRDNPLEDNSGVLKLTNQGNLVILNGTGGTLWTSNSSGASNSPIALLLDTGNLVVKDGNQNNQQIFLWQSFDYLTDTLIAGMKLGFDKRRGLNRYLTSWKSENDPTHGDVVWELDPLGYPQIFLKNGSVDKFRLEAWNGLSFSGLPGARKA